LKASQAILRVLRDLGTVDPIEDQVATWFDTFRSCRLTRRGKPDFDANGDPIPPKNGTVTAMAAYIKLYSRFRLETGRTNGIARFLDDVIAQYSEDDSVSHPAITPEEMARLVAAARREGDDEFATYLRLIYDLGARADSILALRWLDIDAKGRKVHLAREKQSYNRTGFLAQETVDELMALRRGRDDKVGVIFRNRNESGNPEYTTKEALGYWSARRLFIKYASIAGVVGKSLHGIKSARITDLFTAGAPPQVVSKITRTSLRTLTRYNKPSDEATLADFDRFTRRGDV
jgi:integrase